MNAVTASHEEPIVDRHAISSGGSQPTSRDTGLPGVHVVGGLHAGAALTITTDDALLVGADDDCDMILADPGVAAHHCMLTARGDKVTLRPIDAAVITRGHDHPPGETVALAVGERVELGQAVLEIVSATDIAERRAHVPTRPKPARRSVRATLLHQSRWGVTAVLAVAVACEIHPVSRETPVPTALAQTNTANAAAGESAPEGAAVAHDVGEVLRLSGISGDSHYDGNGGVTVKGHLGDPQTLAAVVQSRAMHEITGLKRVSVVNLDHPESPRDANTDTHRIVTAVASKDPYVITTDGSRYYVGATLPGGGRLAGVQDGEVLIEREGEVTHVRLSGT